MFVCTNTAISLDGKISTYANDHVRLGSTEDWRRMSLHRARADAILVGGNSFRNYPYPLLPDLAQGFKPTTLPLLNVIISRSLNFEFNTDYLNCRDISPLFLTSAASVPDTFPFEVVQRKNKISPSWIISVLEKRGVQNLLIEAGGDIIFQFLEADLVNEMNVTLCPKIIGGIGSPGLVAGKGFSINQIRALKLAESEVVGDEIFLKYVLSFSF